MQRSSSALTLAPNAGANAPALIVATLTLSTIMCRSSLKVFREELDVLFRKCVGTCSHPL